MIYTSYFGSKKWNYGNAVSIARYSPRWYQGHIYEPLFPTDRILKMYHTGMLTDKGYADMYYEQVLLHLNPNDIYNDLDGKILLCYEKPDDFCHRHLVAQWLRDFDYPVFELM